MAASNPSFEFWYLLYVCYTTRSFANAKEIPLIVVNINGEVIVEWIN